MTTPSTAGASGGTYVVDVIAGDGIGQEVMPAAVRCIDQVAREGGFSIRWRERDWGSDRFRSDGEMMPKDGLDQLADGDAIFLGAVGAPISQTMSRSGVC
jgi:tartrate dehydrogenase/decarboxylase/D-malate dehydrogenase